MKTPISLVLTTLVVLAANGPACAGDRGAKAATGWDFKPSKAAAAKVKHDLSTLLEPTAQWTHDDQGYEWGFRTKTLPQSTGIQGVCFRDELAFDYAVTVPNEDLGPQPAQPIGVRARRTYHVIDGPVAELGKGSAEDRKRWTADCRNARSDERIFWFPAGRAIEVAKVANAVRLAVTELQAGRIGSASCSSMTELNACKDLILASTKGLRIVGIHGGCQAGAEQECYAVDLDGDRGLVQVTVTAVFNQGELAPTRILSISEGNPDFELGWWDGIHVDPEPGH